ncbi:hypothetical protein KUTeg_012510 [Tegillarca granosa]|uniref:AAA+ ATPase domain-containing protein n=1 Tax=Tegillarca granosa TaxID=220873 RepID=A0ABQ9F3A0_TEGGR|nr:hypothetical protein KUTeg_012510 [Tegillarca granosa]
MEGEAEEETPRDPGEPKPSVLSLIKERLTVQDLKEEMWKEAHEESIQRFIDDPGTRLLVAYNDQYKGFIVEHSIPNFHVDQLTYMIKSESAKEITSDNFLKMVQYGTVKGMHIESLLRMMMGIYAPIFFENTSWPDSIKNDFSAQLHKFLANLTDTRWKLEGKTVLYIPSEGFKLASEDAAKNKDLVQRLETAMIHWARQIKEVLSTQDAFEMAENSGPLDEIEFWKNRCADLTGISTQLDKPGVKKITEILQMAKSSYVAPFLKLSSEIKEGSRQAESNLKFLMVLKDPCYELSEAHPKDIPAMLPKILNTIRMIWVNSEFYKTRERLTGILKKLSNEIINRCCKEINLDKIFDGYVQSGMKTLNECIECCEQWKKIYDQTSKLHHKFSSVGWVLDKGSIFAQIDAFVQRCKDLIEVCESQIHFARREDGNKAEMPHFAGQKGPEIARSLQEIETTFEKNLGHLRAVKKTILDVKATSWHDDYNRFRAGIKDLEVMMQNTITSAFETVTTVEGGVELLDIFMHLSSREAIKRRIDKKTVDVYNMFNEELNSVKKELTQKSQPLSPQHPKYAGQGLWARMLKKRIERGMMILDRAHFLPHIGSGEEVRTQYQGLCLALDEYIRKTFHEWTQTVDKEPMKLLDVPLMCRSAERPPMLDINFNRGLLKMFQEIHYWERLMFEIPHYATDVYNKREDLRGLREHVLLVVRDYNRIIAALSLEERGLFRERIRFLDKKIHPGLTKLTWASKGISDYFVNDCRLHASKVQAIVDDYKGANMEISTHCVKISEMLLIKIDSRKTYENMEFDEEQARHRESVSKRLKQFHEDIIRTMRRTYTVFSGDGQEVQQHWHRYTEKMDKMVEEAFRLNVKWSLQELSKAINGDGKSAPNPLFRVKVCLQGDKVEFQPTLKQLATIIGSIGSHLTKSTSEIQRLPTLLTKRKSTKEPICDVIAKDEEIKKIQTVVNQGMQTNAQNLQNYLSTWDNYREIWEINKDMFIKRYQKLNPQVSSFDADIARYDEVANNVQTQETILNIQFVLLDCSPLKYSILSHCQEWQNKFTTLLSEIATNRLKELHQFLKENGENVSKPPQTLDELGQSLTLWDQLHNGLSETEAKFPPLHDQFSILEKYEVPVPEEVTAMLNDLSGEWVKFQEILIEAETMLKKHKEKFKSGLLAQSEEFKKQVHNLLDEFATKGPFASNITTTDALENIAGIRAQLDALKKQEAEIRRGLNIFKIDQPPSKEIAGLDKDLELIETIWVLNKDWEGLWASWKGDKFTELQTSDMETHSQSIYKKLNRFSKELKDKNWEVVETSKNRVDQFKRTMPLIQDMKNKAMRPRHWDKIQTEMSRQFDHQAEDFTLEKIIDYGFDQYAEMINDVSGAATKELAIEQALEGITNTWNTTELDIAPYKDRGHFKVRSTEDVFTALEDNQVQLSTMKASRFVKAFEQEVDKWERTLSLILEVVEMLLTVQRQWMYLENIFLGEDIRKQLPRESAEFDDVNSRWKVVMTRLNKDRNALRGTHHEGMLDDLNDMNLKLEEIQKSLDMYLETKRQIFPRFYFLSNDDLLEILGQSKNPKAVQPHLKKCFDNIKSLEMIKPSVKWEASGMWSTEGEFVEYDSPMISNQNPHVLLEGPVEAWLCDVERTMRWNLKDDLKVCKAALKKHMTKRDKWIKDHPGQVAMLNKFSEAIRGNLQKMQRLKIVALVTIEVHARDIIEKLIKTGCSDENAFEWLSQLRFYWEKSPIDDCVIKQTNTQFQYGYEYLGNSGRLVITPLTDRCYMTLTTALHLHRGGSPKGPAGTGKTETVKDLGKSLGMYVIVVNCSEGLDYKSMGRMFSGLAQTGAWGCFDEFNRINIEVLSVVAQQILSILSALAAGSQRFVFEGREIDLVWSCGIFITMNPGYAGRTELPDNLKSMFRPIAMVTPDSNLIAEIILFGEGFSNAKGLAKKVYTLYSLAIQQLSKQDHYDFGLRALVSVLRYAGRKKRSNPNMPDEEILLLSMKDMNIARLTSEDLPLFNGIMQDLFPGIETPVIDYSQLYETKTSRHSVMIVGHTQSGKTTTWRVLQASMSRLNKVKDSGFQTVKSMNSVMDDNKILTLINGERISMPEQVSLLFEVEDLAVASPATVSRCGMVYSDYNDLGFGPFIDSWLIKKKEAKVDPTDTENFTRMVELWFQFCMIWSICASVDEDGLDTVRYEYLVNTLISSFNPVMMVGPVGTGKTSVVESTVNKLDPKSYSVLTVNMSAQTTSNQVQDVIESRVEKRTKGVYVPIGGKKLLTFMDDFNMPAKDTFGSQPPLELIRLWLDYGFWYDRLKQTTKYIKDMFLLAALGPPGGGRMIISRRLQSRFNLINMTFPQESQIKRIFGSMISQKLQDFEEEVKPIADIMTQATIEMYQAVVQKFLPTPTKIHYLFNLRDISKGILRSFMCNSCIFRVFSDRLVEDKDHEAFISIMTEKLGSLFDQTYHNICPNKQPPIFGDYMNPDNVYEDIQDIVSKIVRVIRQPRGNMLLIGIGGSGRQSLTRLSAYICEFSTFQIEVTKQYRKQEFRDDLKRLYWQAGVDNKTTVFIFNDVQVVEESFLEDINNILSSGEVPNLYKPDEFEEVRNALSETAKKEGIDDSPQSIFAYLIDRVRANLHVVLCMSPVGEPFRNRIRMYPAFVNCTTIDWFSEWPQDALLEVADKYLQEASLGTEEEKELGDAAYKLRNGLSKIDETREKVEKMSVELEDAKLKVAQFQKQCDEYLVVIVQNRREADEQQKKGERIAEEEVKCQHMADLAQHDLDEALPALEEAIKALDSLNKKDIGEIRSYGRPPTLVEKVMEAVMILKGCEPTWAESKRQLGDQNFIKSLMFFDKDNISDRVLKKIGTYCAQSDFQPEIIGRVSLAARSLCMWVRAMEVYGRIYRVVEPKKQRLNAAMSQLKEKQDALADAKAKLAEDLEERIGYLVGDCLLASAFMSYMGPFLSEYRDAMLQKVWLAEKYLQKQPLLTLPSKNKVKKQTEYHLVKCFLTYMTGLEAQLLGIVVRKEKEELEVTKDNLVRNIAAGKKKLVDLEDEILRLLSETKGSLLDDEQLVNTLQTSKVTSQEVTEQLQISEQTEVKIDAAREVIDRENQMDNPCSNWLSDTAWDNITELEKLANFHGIITAFEQYPRDWNIWYTSAEPEVAPLPGEWDNACNELQRMLIVRSLRPDRVSFCATTFIINNLGSRFVEPPVLDMQQVVEDSTTRTPLIFVLSPGVGNWVFLANCHLSLSWMPQLDKLVEQLQIEEPHPEFRLWLSSSPHPEFPISILQTGIKMTTEPPKGLKANMKRLYNLVTEQQFLRCTKPDKYKKLLFCLCFFHSVLLERKKFLMLGWNIAYEFNDSDFEVSENLLSIYLDGYDETPWDALKYLIAGINYGGHVTDDYDRRLLLTYINDLFHDGVITTPFYKCSVLQTYYVPKDGPLSSYKEYVSMLPNVDHPEAFGQHPNADIASQIQETRMLFTTLLSLQPQVSATGGESREDKIQRYNALLDEIRKSLTDLEKGIQGLVVMTVELENIFTCIFDGNVPPSWLKAYPSLKPLASWTRDLVLRVEQFQKWALTAHAPTIFWMSAFTFPTGFLTAVLQTAARMNSVSVDTLSWEFSVMTVDDSNITGPPKDGVYIKGLYLEGAGWDKKNSCLIEATPMQLVCPIPTIHFKPVENKKKTAKGMYTSPCYYYPNRAGVMGRPSFVVAVELKSGEKTSDHWTKRGTALLMSLDY